MATILEVKDLKTRFYTQDGTVHAVNGVSFSLDEGEVLGIVGESGCGKSVSMLSLLRLIPVPPGKVTDGEVLFEGRDLLKMTDDEIRQVRGNRIAMIFQDPMTSLNPVLTIKQQVSEALQLHLGMDKETARERSIELLTMVGIPSAGDRIDDYPHQFSGGMRQRVMIAMALACNPQILIGRDDSGPDRRSSQAPAGRHRDGRDLDHPRYEPAGPNCGSDQRDVCRLHHRDRRYQGTVLEPSAPLHARSFGVHSSLG